MSKQCCDAQIFGEDEHTIDCEAPRIMTKKLSAPAPRLHSPKAPKEKKIECAICGMQNNEMDKLMVVCYWLISQCKDTNATEMKTTQSGVTRFGEKIGDWEITVKKL